MVRQERPAIAGIQALYLQAAAVQVAVRADGQDRSEPDILVESAFETDFLSVCDYLDKSNIDNILNHMMIPRLLLGTAIAGVASIDAGRASQTARGDQDQWSRTCQRIWRAPPGRSPSSESSHRRRYPGCSTPVRAAPSSRTFEPHLRAAPSSRTFEPHLRAAPSSPGRRVRVRRPLLPDQADLARES
jgi:hypothetical protein